MHGCNRYFDGRKTCGCEKNLAISVLIWYNQVMEKTNNLTSNTETMTISRAEYEELQANHEHLQAKYEQLKGQ